MFVYSSQPMIASQMNGSSKHIFVVLVVSKGLHAYKSIPFLSCNFWSLDFLPSDKEFHHLATCAGHERSAFDGVGIAENGRV